MDKTHFDKKALTIEVYTGEDYYQVDLERCENAAQLLDWILQITGKRWCSPQTLHEFFECLEDACREVFDQSAQVVYCPSGVINEVDWAKASKKRR